MPAYPKSQQLHKKETARTTLALKGQKQGKIKAKTARKLLKLMSKRAKEELKVWTTVKRERMKLLFDKFNYVPCELCHGIIREGKILLKSDPHHNDRDRRNNELDNCRILHRRCHTKVHDENIKDVPSLL